MLDLSLQQQLAVALGIPPLQQPSEELGDRLLPSHEQCVLGNRTWTWDEDQYYFVVDFNFSFASSKGDYTDAANKDRLMGSLITTSKT